MPITIKDSHWTLCQSCKEAQVTTDVRGHTRIWCKNQMQPIEITAPVAACNDHRAIGQMTEYDAKEIGWVLETRKNGAIGFRAPKKETP